MTISTKPTAALRGSMIAGRKSQTGSRNSRLTSVTTNPSNANAEIKVTNFSSANEPVRMATHASGDWKPVCAALRYGCNPWREITVRKKGAVNTMTPNTVSKAFFIPSFDLPKNAHKTKHRKTVCSDASG